MGWDRHVEHWVVTNRVGFLDPVFRSLTYIGNDGLVWIALSLVLVWTQRRARAFLLVVAADVLTQLSTGAIKLAVPRARPHVHTLVAEPHSHSFPSGHSASSFACAVVLASLAPAWRIPLFVLAALIAWSRVYVGVHYPFDVLAGVLLGIALGILVLELQPRVSTWAERRRSRNREQ